MTPGKHLQHPPEVDYEKYRTLHGNATMLQLTSVHDVNTRFSLQSSHCQNVALLSPEMNEPEPTPKLQRQLPSRGGCRTTSPRVPRTIAQLSDLLLFMPTADNRSVAELNIGCTYDYKGALNGNKDAVTSDPQLAALVHRLQDLESQLAALVHRLQDLEKKIDLTIIRVHQESNTASTSLDAISAFMHLLQHKRGIYFLILASLPHHILTNFIVTVTSQLLCFNILLSTIMWLLKRQSIGHSTYQGILEKSPFTGLLKSFDLKKERLLAYGNYNDTKKEIKLSSIYSKKSFDANHYILEKLNIFIDHGFSKHSELRKKKDEWSTVSNNYSHYFASWYLLLADVIESQRVKRSESIYLDRQASYGNHPAAIWEHDSGGERSRLDWNATKNMPMLANNVALAIKNHEDVTIDTKCDDSLRLDMQEPEEPLPCVQQPVDERSVEPSTLVRTPDQGMAIDSSNDLSTQRTADSSTEVFEDDSDSRLSRLFSFSEEMQRLFQGRQPLSYYFISDSELIVHIECPSQEDHSLEARVMDVLKSCHMSAVKVTVKNYSVGAQLCSGSRVGSTVFVTSQTDERRQLLGVYLEYDDRVYWVSTAHAVLQVLYSEHALDLDRPIGDSYVTLMHPREQKLGVTFDHTHILPTPYLCFSYNNCEYSDSPACHHSVDIMVGTVPLTSSDLSRNGAHAVRDEMLFVGHRRNANDELFKCYSTGVAFYSPFGRNGRFLFNVNDVLKGRVVYTTLNGEVMVSGKIMDVLAINSLSFRLLEAPSLPETLSHGSKCTEPIQAFNVIFIEPLCNFRPILGHSGSVWFIPDERNTVDEIYYKAVAVTIAITEIGDHPKKTIWIATPLCAALFALSKKYPNVFPNYKSFKTTSLSNLPTERTTT